MIRSFLGWCFRTGSPRLFQVIIRTGGMALAYAFVLLHDHDRHLGAKFGEPGDGYGLVHDRRALLAERPHHRGRRRFRPDLDFAESGVARRAAGEAKALMELAGLPRGLSAIEKRDQVASEYQRRSLIGESRQASLQPSPNGAFRDLQGPRRIVDGVVAMFLDGPAVRAPGHP
ncbi:hypothetical protein [Aurantimonas marianensis]|uniref:Uncharacterized protein n=1 Tax=Aurantimonas marianensis TaxID=2920428 RepID=A0A9X2KG31_9HYPH|nr:hypothetical protein [Aurantimonas marianensis]MCP3055855.1 hypothetical protein [Aurantimonas marianensis]